jgi:hypothetical protein
LKAGVFTNIIQICDTEPRVIAGVH